MKKYKFYQVVEYKEDPTERRLIYTFNNEMAANDMVEFILQNDDMPIDVRVEEYETTA